MMESPRSVPRLANLPDKTLAEWKDLMRRGFEAGSLADTFIAAMACALREPPEDGVSLQDRRHRVRFSSSVNYGQSSAESALGPRKPHSHCSTLAR